MSVCFCASSPSTSVSIWFHICLPAYVIIFISLYLFASRCLPVSISSSSSSCITLPWKQRLLGILICIRFLLLVSFSFPVVRNFTISLEQLYFRSFYLRCFLICSLLSLCPSAVLFYTCRFLILSASISSVVFAPLSTYSVSPVSIIVMSASIFFSLLGTFQYPFWSLSQSASASDTYFFLDNGSCHFLFAAIHHIR